MTFLTTRPPDLIRSPRPVAAWTPSRWSRAAPALIRRGPARLQAKAPPIVPPSAGPPSKRAVVGRLEGELLLARRQAVLDLDERGAGARRHHQLGRLVERDAGEAREVDAPLRLDRPAEPPLAAAAHDLERHLLGGRPGDQLLELRGRGRTQILGHRPSTAVVRPTVIAAAATGPAAEAGASRPA